VQQALADYDRRARAAAEGPRAPDLADALIRLEQDRERAKREERQGGHSVAEEFDTWALGVERVWDWLQRR
jgi:hypothetical protein